VYHYIRLYPLDQQTSVIDLGLVLERVACFLVCRLLRRIQGILSPFAYILGDGALKCELDINPANIFGKATYAEYVLQCQLM